MHDFQLSKFMYETLAGGYPNQLPISSVCNARCFFCSNKMNPFSICREGFRSLEDIRKGIEILSDKVDEIRLGDSLPGRVSEGEALLHPEIHKILGLIRERFSSQTIQVNTNATMLTKSFVESLVPFSPMKFTVSYHSENPKHWSEIFRLGQKQYEIARDSFFHLVKHKFAIEGAIVPLPSMVGYDDIENTIKSLQFSTRKIIVYPPGYSSKTPQKTRRLLKTDFVALSAFLSEMRKKYGMHFSFPGDPLQPLDFRPRRVMMETFNKRFDNVLWVLSEAAYERAGVILEAHSPFVPNQHHPIQAKNHTYRGNIVCSGLLMTSDYRTAIKKGLRESKKKGIKIDLVLVSARSFDRLGDDLRGENYSHLIDEFKMPVWRR